MRYPIDKELHSLYLHKLPEKVRLFSVMNGILQMYKCESDEKATVTVHEIPGYQNEMIKTYVIEPKNVEKVLPCLVFFHGGGFLLKASEAHYQITKEYAERIPRLRLLSYQARRRSFCLYISRRAFRDCSALRDRLRTVHKRPTRSASRS